MEGRRFGTGAGRHAIGDLLRPRCVGSAPSQWEATKGSQRVAQWLFWERGRDYELGDLRRTAYPLPGHTLDTHLEATRGNRLILALRHAPPNFGFPIKFECHVGSRMDRKHTCTLHY